MGSPLRSSGFQASCLAIFSRLERRYSRCRALVHGSGAGVEDRAVSLPDQPGAAGRPRVTGGLTSDQVAVS